MSPEEWPQRVLYFTDWEQAESIAVTDLLPILESSDLRAWAFLRKSPAWRLRFRATTPAAEKELNRALDQLVTTRSLTSWTPGIYEPETTAFGGPAAMAAVHLLFHQDSRQVLRHLARQQSDVPDPLGRREIAILTLSSALRAAGLDWYEQGDVWARVAAQRHGGAVSSDRLRTAAHRLLTLDTQPSSRPMRDGRLAVLAGWLTVFADLGHRLADLNKRGQLERGLRAVLAHTAIFHFNRLGLSAEDQHTLSTCAKEVIMGTSDSAAAAPTTGPSTASVGVVNTDTIDATAADRLRTQLVDQLVKSGKVHTSRVEAAMRTIPRHLFVPDASLEQAYTDAPVNTKYDEGGISISCASQPSIVGMMLEQLQVEPGHRVLELGAGTGYNAGLLGHLTGEKGHVTTIDVDDDIVHGARVGLGAAGLDNVEVILGDGAVGYGANAPYDRIVATVGAHGVPHAWLDQLAPGGRLLTPLRLRGSVSRSIAFERDPQGAWRSVGSEMNTFMPLRRGIADDPRQLVQLTEDASVTLVTNGDQDVQADALAGALARPGVEVWSGVTFRGPESAEWLELWLTCTLPNGLSRMPVQAAAYEAGVVSSPYPSATATFDGGTVTYLSRRAAAEKAPDGATLYEFGVIGHGPQAQQLAERVAKETQTWDQEYRGRDVAFAIQSRDIALADRPGRFSLDNGLNRVIIEWQ
ncbi:methyltransferase, FxLD system [Streptomyces chartreusis]|uniref:Protein-L-isoaspartate O-methyltransferase n=1 Tax=Streptomyces chartreusis TaxID=1969 RepID=A0A7H8TE97_STRCX|nr:methyltransferase, FxLD system [Streptomyces chartreusis]QKZ20370.1 methyltransferase, FxLD system [Streptomyces chartreusis]